MDWLYVWSPRYRFFHECLYATCKDLSGFQLTPIFAEQHLFTPIKTISSHFLAGIPIKIHVICNYIENNFGKRFFFTDVDLIVLPEFGIQDLEPYMKYDITTMKECHQTSMYNIGCMLIHCSPKTLVFFKKVRDKIVQEKLLDQDAFEQEAPSFDGTIGLFDVSQFLQSNMLDENSDSYKIIQCLTSSTDKTEIFLEKLATLESVFDISQLAHFLPDDVLDAQGRMCQS